MGYIWDIIVCFVGVVVVLVILNLIFGDIHAKDSWIYWGVWIAGFVGLFSKWYDRNRRGKMKRVILEDQYNQAVKRKETL
jgi:O-antigen/teichoic acid export membrane protein